MQGGALAQHGVPKGEKQGLKGPQDKASDAFDRLRRELVFSARGQVSPELEGVGLWGSNRVNDLGFSTDTWEPLSV